MNQYLIGLDIGTSSVKAGLFDRDGHLLAAASRPLSTLYPETGWAEQSPRDWWYEARRAIGEIVKGVDPADIAALGLCGQCPGEALVDEDFQSLGPALIWRDRRAWQEAAWLSDHVTTEQALAWTGMDRLNEAGFPPARLLWLKKHRPEDWAHAIKVLQPKDFVALRLTGRATTDRHSAFCLAHLETGAYSSPYFDLLGVPVEMMPEMLEPAAIAGEITLEASRLTGLKEGTPVISGTIDAYCDALAGGVAFADRAIDVAGTSEIVSLAISGVAQGQGVYPSTIAGVGTFLCGPTQAGGDTLRWMAGCLYAESGGSPDFTRMEQEAQAAPAGSEGVIFLPYLDGERAPIWDANARGVFSGLSLRHDRRHCTRAVYESIGFAVRHILETEETAAGKKAAEIVVCGGGSRSRFWNQAKADILQRPVHPAPVSETGCLGAAMLASVGAGIVPDLLEASIRMAGIRETVMPRLELANIYEASYRTYRQLYVALKPFFAATKL